MAGCGTATQTLRYFPMGATLARVDIGYPMFITELNWVYPCRILYGLVYTRVVRYTLANYQTMRTGTISSHYHGHMQRRVAKYIYNIYFTHTTRPPTGWIAALVGLAGAGIGSDKWENLIFAEVYSLFPPKTRICIASLPAPPSRVWFYNSASRSSAHTCSQKFASVFYFSYVSVYNLFLHQLRRNRCRPYA